MSINDKINEIKSDIANAYEVVANKGGSIPSVSGSANLAQAIASIPEGGTSSDLEYEWWSPKMTSNTDPSPYVVSASGYTNDTYSSYKAFDEDKDTFWVSTIADTQWIQIDMGESRKNVSIAGLSLLCPNRNASDPERFPTVFSIQGSNDGFVWTDILKVDESKSPLIERGSSREYYFKETHYRYYRLYITNWPIKEDGSLFILISEILFYRAIGNSYAVTSFNGRTGDILPQDGDYSAKKISFSSETLEATNVQEAIEEIANSGGGASTFSVKAPVGTIVIWSGTEDDIPKGWHLCDGTNGTPNLKDRFVLGAGNTYKVNSSGGAATVALTENQIPEHRHSYRSPASTGQYATTSSSGGSGRYEVYSYSNSSTGAVGSSVAHNNMPPYYALCYIMKVEPDETDFSAENTTFEPGDTGLEATNVQQAIEELAKSGGSGGGIVNWENVEGRPNLSNASSKETILVTLSADGWESNEQTVIATGVTDDVTKLVIPIPDKKSEDIYYDSDIRCILQGENSLTFYAETVPIEDVSVVVNIIGNLDTKPISIYNWWSPKMTSNTEPSPYVASASSEAAETKACNVFDANKDTYWRSKLDTSNWIQIDIGENGKNVEISGISISIISNYIDQFPIGFSIQGSNDNFVWTDILKVDEEKPSDLDMGSYYSREYYFAPSHYRYYRLYITKTADLSTNSFYTRLSEILFYRAEVIE